MLFRHRRFCFRKDKSSLSDFYTGCVFCGGRVSASASLTLEAACVLPLFFCAVLAMLYFTDAAALQVRLLNGIRDTGRAMATAAAAKGAGEGEALGLGGTVLSAAYAKQSIQRSSGGLKTSVLEGDISLLGSSFLENEMIDLRAGGKLKIPVPFFRLRSIRFWQRGFVRAWTGRSLGTENGGGEAAEDSGHVYVTVTGTVYHKDVNCTHIRLSIQQVSLDRAKELRSADGSKYYPCGCYKRSPGGTVYVAREGNRYHAARECSGLKRSIKKMTASEAQYLRPCTRCGG